MEPLPLPRLKPAHDIYRGTDGEWRISSPGDRFDRIELPDDVMTILSQALTTPSGEKEVEPDLLALLDAFTAQGYARTPVTGGVNGSVCLRGESAYMRLASHLLVSAGVPIVGENEDPVITVFGQLNLDDAAMLRADTCCSRSGVAAHRAFAEGGHWFVGPVTLPGRTATYADYRGRRLAACDVPEELLQYWQALAALPPRHPAPGTAALIAGFLAADVLSFLAGEEPPTAGYQIEIDPETIEIMRHPVLPLPAGLWEVA